MHPQLARALEPVLRDLGATGGPVPEVVDEPWDPDPAAASALLRGRGDGGSGTNLVLDRPLPEQVARVTEQVQEWAIEELWGTAPTNWPRCPRHPGTHPLEVRAGDDRARWTCPRDGVPVAEVGGLS